MTVATAKLIRNDVDTVDGKPAMLLFGKGQNDEEVCIAVPLQAVMTLVADTRRRAF
jgi:hypothetical protein